MADTLATVSGSDLLGFGTVTGTAASPNTLLSATAMPAGANYVTLQNLDSTNWLFARSNTEQLYKVAAPGGQLTIAAGPQNANGITKVVGFATTPNNAGTATLVAAVVSIKTA